jgi:hypothetical protein
VGLFVTAVNGDEVVREIDEGKDKDKDGDKKVNRNVNKNYIFP